MARELQALSFRDGKEMDRESYPDDEDDDQNDPGPVPEPDPDEYGDEIRSGDREPPIWWLDRDRQPVEAS